MFICFSLMRWFNIIIIFKAAFKEFQIFSHFSHHLSFSLVVPLICPMFLWSRNIKVVIANVYFYQLLRATVVWNNILLVIFYHAQSNLVETWFILNEHFLIFNQKHYNWWGLILILKIYYKWPIRTLLKKITNKLFNRVFTI